MRLIDADALLRDFPIRLDHYDEEHGNIYFVFGIETVLDYVEEMPTVNLVRCGECRHESRCSHNVQHTTYDAHSTTIGYKSIDFCSYGERRE